MVIIVEQRFLSGRFFSGVSRPSIWIQIQLKMQKIKITGWEIYQGKGTLFRNIQIIGEWNYSASGSRRVSLFWFGFLCLNTPPFLEIYTQFLVNRSSKFKKHFVKTVKYIISNFTDLNNWLKGKIRHPYHFAL